MSDTESGPKLRLTYDEERRIEGYAKALDDMIRKVSGEGFSAKSYDPMTVEGTKMYSYAFDMKDGARCHSVTDYESVEEIESLLLAEVYDWLKGEGYLP